MWASVCFNQSKLIFSQSKIVNKLFKNQILTYSTHLFQKFSNFPLSLSLYLSLSPTRQGSTANFFVVFLQISCKVSLSLSRYVYITLPFALIFTFSCIISWFFRNFQKMHNLGFLINQALFYKFDQWVLLLQCCIHDLYWLIWSIWGFAKN